MRILIAGTVNYPALNGQAVFTERLAEGLAKRGHDVLSIFPSETGKPYRTWRRGVEIEAFGSLNLSMIHSDTYLSLFSGRDIQRVFNSFEPEIVHIQDHYPLSFDVVQAARRRHVGLIGTNHFMPENIAAYVPLLSKVKPVYNRIAWTWMLMTYNQLHVATAQSKASAALMKSQGLNVPVYPVSCGLDLRRFHLLPSVDRNAVRGRYGIDLKKKVFLFVGRVDKEKCLDVLLHAMHQLSRDDVQLVIAGHGTERENLEALAKELQLGERVHFTGFIPREDLPLLLNSIDVFTMPSQAELLSIASLEAMACGRPVLLADAVALPELVTVGGNGYLFKPGNPSSAAHYINVLADQPEEWAKMGALSVEKARYHGMESTIRQYEDIYVTLLQENPAPVPAT
jgi:glycosyltransferase involved in cell wall biosynthesis